MQQNIILQENQIVFSSSSSFSPCRSAFKPISQNQAPLPFSLSKMQKQNDINSKQLNGASFHKGPIMDSDCWQREQIEKLFKLYNYYGPQWKVMSLEMLNRTPNNLKNRFYTILRNLMKLLFRSLAQSCPKVPGEIASKDLSRLYDGKEDYFQFKSLLNDILEKINYDLTNSKIEELAHKHSIEIQRVYSTIYADRSPCFNKRPSISEKTTEPEKILPVTSLPDKKIFSILPEAPSANSTSNPIVQPSECMYVFFFNPVGIQIPQNN